MSATPSKAPRHVPMYRPNETTPVVQVIPQATYVQPQPYYAPPPPPAPLPPQQQPKQRKEKHRFWKAITSPIQPKTFQLIVFHLINLFFAIVAFSIVLTLGLLGIGLIPLFCLGIVILQVLLYTVHFFAQCDAYLYNCVAPNDAQITVQFDIPRRGLYHFSGYRIAPDLSRFSKEGGMAIFYFIFVKFPLALIFSSIVLTLLAMSIALIAIPFVDKNYIQIDQQTWRDHDLKFIHHLHVEKWTPTGFVVRGVILLYITILLMHIFARIHRYATKFFTCEFFATSGVLTEGTAVLPQYAPVPTAPLATTYATAPLYEAYPAAAPVAAPVATAVPLRSSRTAFERYASKFGYVLLLAVLSFINLLFSIGMFVVVMIAMSLTIGLLPVACTGLLILYLLAVFAKPLSAADTWLYEQRRHVYSEIVRDD
ncbi:hypothetical protein Ae201684P_021304 [Aphanomyces euteiches]|uniref:Putative sensor domain-containing protein n=1 Tax=Aphanomyces euteiches TaxID=100861 RepID=A0A6G0X773_9STRA|nr:hypothetical protein Ae201684_007871 [Aphanomyces euteiches]KAH9067137.1 hypothetical protein Ae201684P_021304 [Aphanomyces euteiches]